MAQTPHDVSDPSDESDLSDVNTASNQVNYLGASAGENNISGIIHPCTKHVRHPSSHINIQK